MTGLEKIQRVLEEAIGNLQGIVDELGADLGDLRNGISGQVSTLKGAMTHAVDSSKTDIGNLQTNTTTQLGDLTRKCYLTNKNELSQAPNANIAPIQSHIFSSQGIPWVVDS